MFHPEGPSLAELAVQAFSSTARGYDLLAPKFDYTPFRTPDSVLAAVSPHIGAPASVGSALDVCCGTGAALEMLWPLCRNRVVGLDFSRGMLEVCRERLAADPGGAATVSLVLGDALRMPFDSAFDMAVCFGALGHIARRDQSRFVAQVARALHPGGRFVFVSSRMPQLWSWRYWAARAFNAAMHARNRLPGPPFVMYYLRFLVPEATELLESAGFKVEARELDLGDGPDNLVLVIATRM